MVRVMKDMEVKGMNNYKVRGESREVGAIGIFKEFIVNIVAKSSREAYNQVRESMYQRNREHVLIKEIREVEDSGSTIVEPRAYL